MSSIEDRVPPVRMALLDDEGGVIVSKFAGRKGESCDYCGRDRRGPDGEATVLISYGWTHPSTPPVSWDPHVFCRLDCYRRFHGARHHPLHRATT